MYDEHVKRPTSEETTYDEPPKRDLISSSIQPLERRFLYNQSDFSHNRLGKQ